MLHYVLSTMLGNDCQKNEIPDPYPQGAKTSKGPRQHKWHPLSDPTWEEPGRYP